MPCNRLPYLEVKLVSQGPVIYKEGVGKQTEHGLRCKRCGQGAGDLVQCHSRALGKVLQQIGHERHSREQAVQVARAAVLLCDGICLPYKKNSALLIAIT
jgi:hypothetical protein